MVVINGRRNQRGMAWQGLENYRPYTRVMQLHTRLDAWLKGRIGYGSLSAPAWYIGAEEACGGRNELERRLGVGTVAESDTMVEDLQQAHARITDGAQLFAGVPRLQPTWNKLIHAHLVATTNDTPTRDDRRTAQRDWWGRTQVDAPQHQVLLAELWPLPCPHSGVKHWRAMYGDLGREDLASRAAYEAQWGPERHKLFESLIEVHRPKWVVAYGGAAASAASLWAGQRTEGVHIIVGDIQWGRVAKAGGTVFIQAPHPVSRQGNALAGWAAAGRAISTRMADFIHLSAP